ncbi:beta-N-acetylglucosaminidase domain-containing protein [Mycoplasma sp. 613B]
MKKNKQIKKFIPLITLSPAFFVSVSFENSVSQNHENYNINPYVKNINYLDKNYVLSSEINLVIEDGISENTVNNIKNILSAKNYSFTSQKKIIESKTNILIGNKLNNDTTVDNLLLSEINRSNDIVQKNDSYILTSKNNVIGAFGLKENSEFYASETFKQIFNQLKNRTIEEFIIKDFSLTKNRGIIEGSQNTNWSNEQRFKYLDYAKKQKLNKYFYWNWFDKKTNADWKLKYSNKEKEDFLVPFINKSLENNIEPVFMFNIFQTNKVRVESFDSDLENFKQKVLDLINLKISKFGFIFNENSDINLSIQEKFFTKFKEWFDNLPAKNKEIFIALNNFEIINNFDKNQAESVNKLKEFINTIPNTFEIITNPGKTFNKVNNQFLSDFIEVTGRNKVNLWSNWINLSNKQNNLILGGVKENLDINFDETKIDGVLLNPSLFFEHSQIPLYVLSSYLWNNIKSDEERERLYNESFKNLIGSEIEYKELIEVFKNFSSHSLYQNIPVPNEIDESLNIKDKILNLQSILNSKTYTIDQVNSLKTDFIELKNKLLKLKNYYFKNSFVKEFSPWIDSFYDLTQGVIYLLDALNNLQNNQVGELGDNLYLGKFNVNNSKENHSIDFQNFLVKPEVGTKYIQPFIEQVIGFLEEEQTKKLNFSEVDINKVNLTFISNRRDTPESDKGNIFLANNREEKLFTNPDAIVKDDYFGVEFSEPIKLNSIYIKMGGGRDHFFYSRIQYKQNDEVWKDLNGEIYERFHDNIRPITVNNLNIKNVTGVRLIANRSNPEAAWLRITNFLINQNEIATNKLNYTDLQANMEDSTAGIAVRAGSIESVKDNNYATQWTFSDSATGPGSSKISQDKIVAFKFPSKRLITRIELDQGQENGRDRLNNFKIEYYDYTSSSWKLFGSKNNLGNQFNHVVHGYAFTDKFRFYNNATVNSSWWRIAGLRVGYDDYEKKQEYTASLDNARILGREEIRASEYNNSINYVVDNTDYTSTVIASSDNSFVKNNVGFKVDFKYPRAIREISILQSNKHKIPSVKILKLVNDETFELLSDVKLNDDWTTIKLPENSGVFTGIKILSNQDTTSYWEVKSVNFKFDGINTNEFLLSNIANKENLTTSHVDNLYKLFSIDKENSKNQYHMNSGEFIGIDLKETKTINGIDLDWEKTENISIFRSIDGVNWYDLNVDSIASSPTQARYIIFRNQSVNALDITFNKMFIQTEKQTVFGKLIDTNITPLENDNFKENFAFDGDFTTVSKISKSLRPRDFLTYDLGSLMNINSIKIFSDINNINWLRSADIQISQDNTNWETVYTVDDYGSKFSYKKLFDTNFGFYDSKYPNYRYWGISDLENKKARYLKIFINHNYPNNRGLFINEILINDGNDQTNNNIAGFSGTNIESKNPETSVLNLIDEKLRTYYEPKNENGTLKYSFAKNEYNNKYLNIVSVQEPSLAEVSATIYSEETHQTKEVVLGHLVALNSGFNLPIDDQNKIISLSIKWTNKKPKIAEITFLDNAHTNSETNKIELDNLVLQKNNNYNNWIQEDKELYDKVIAKGQLTKDSANINQSTIDSIVAEINSVIASARLKADLSQLSNLISEKIDNSNHQYTSLSYQEYNRIYSYINKIISENQDITQETLEQLVSLYNEAKIDLEASIYQLEEARINVRKFYFLYKSVYTTESVDRLATSSEAIKHQLTINLNDEEKYKELNLNFIDNYNKLEYNKLGEFNEKYINEIRPNFENILTNEWVKWEELSKELQSEFNKKDEIIMSDNINLRDKETNLNFLKNLFDSFSLEKAKELKLLKSELIFNVKYQPIYSEEVFNNINNIINSTDEKISNKTLEYKEISGIKADLTKLKSQFDFISINKKINDLKLINEIAFYKDKLKTLDKNEDNLLSFVKELEDKKQNILEEINKTEDLISKLKNPIKQQEFSNQKEEAKSEQELKELQLKINDEIKEENKTNPFLKIGVPIISSISVIGLIILAILLILKKKKSKR